MVVIAAYLYMEKENADSAAMSRDFLVRLPSAIGPRFCGLYRIYRILDAVLGPRVTHSDRRESTEGIRVRSQRHRRGRTRGGSATVTNLSTRVSR